MRGLHRGRLCGLSAHMQQLLIDYCRKCIEMRHVLPAMQRIISSNPVSKKCTNRCKDYLKIVLSPFGMGDTTQLASCTVLMGGEDTSTPLPQRGLAGGCWYMCLDRPDTL